MIAAPLILALYIPARTALYNQIQTSTFAEWIVLDGLVTAPRLIALLLTLIVYSKAKYRTVTAATSIGNFLKVLVVMLILIAAETELNPRPMVGQKLIMLFMFSSLMAGFFEEYLFRGLIFDWLRQRNLTIAVIISSAIFTLYHWDVQPFGAFPAIFLFGVLFCQLKIYGFSLSQLALLHFIFNAGFLFFVPSKSITALSLSIFLLLVAIAYYQKRLNDFARELAG